MIKEKELRLALVCYGGVSLAVYMHGVTKEILKLARASKAYHSTPDQETRQKQRYIDVAVDHVDECDSEAVYFEILKMIGASLDLRVVVDVIAGASAGGINGVILARALAHNLAIDGLREFWLRQADVAELLAPEGKARGWSKWFLRPLIWAYARTALGSVDGSGEIRRKLSMFLRSRWFRPPFGGARLLQVLFDGIGGMAAPSDPTSSLLPNGQQLELFVTVTDFYGYLRRIRIHDPAMVSEREHRHMLRFKYCRWPTGDFVSDFTDDDVPGLCFASRATSSFPGAFPPAQIGEIDRLLTARRQGWSGREKFLSANFRHYLDAEIDPADTSFLDGSVLNNKPFAAAIRSIRDRPAFRQVDRRLVYIDPDPVGPPPPPDGEPPGFFRALKGALSDIPRQEPIYDDLNWVAGFNLRVRRANAVIEATRAQVGKLVADLAPDAFAGVLSAERVTAWRETANAYTASQAGFAYDGYRQLKLLSVLNTTSELFRELCEFAPGAWQADAVGYLVNQWARRSGVLPPRQRSGSTGAAEDAAQWTRFLRRFDIDFRRRRLRFVVQNLNRLYSRLGDGELEGLSAERLDRIKAQLYRQLDAIRIENDGRVPDNATQSLKATLKNIDLKAFESDMEAGAELTSQQEETLDDALSNLAEYLDLAGFDASADMLFAEISAEDLPETVIRELLTAYIGFAFWDVLTFSITSWRDLGEFDEIRIDRISPDDAASIRSGGAAATLKGIEFGHFGAFFSRLHRENDYLWGRLHGAERMIDLLYDAASHEGATDDLDRRALKKTIFNTILEAETGHLKASGALIATLRAEIAAL